MNTLDDKKKEMEDNTEEMIDEKISDEGGHSVLRKIMFPMEIIRNKGKTNHTRLTL